MIIHNGNSSKENDQKINDLLGENLSFLKKILFKTNESKILKIKHISPHFRIPSDEIDNYKYGKLELRPNGVIIHLLFGVQKISWAIPFYQLVIYKSNGFSIHAQGYVVKFECDVYYQNNLDFIDKMINDRNTFLDQHGMNSH